MDGFNEKKWFVYMGDHHEGPFAIADIQQKMQQGQVTPASYIWAEGMPDWKPMVEVPAFAGVSSPPPSNVTPIMPTLSATSTATPSAAHASIRVEPVEHHQNIPAAAAVGAGASALSVNPALSPLASPATVAAAAPASLVGGAPAAAQPKKALPKGVLVGMLILLLTAGGAMAYFQGYLNPVLNSPGLQAGIKAASDAVNPLLQTLAEKVPLLGQWISPIASIDDVTPEDYEELKTAASSHPEKGGLKVGVVQSRADTSSPSFYVASNLPDNTAIDVYVIGIPDTLLNQSSFASKLQVRLTKKLGKSAALKTQDGKVIPRGQYWLFITESEVQVPEAKNALAAAPAAQVHASAYLPTMFPKAPKLFASKTLFLGGSKDSFYTQRLNEYHEMLRKKATDELAEVKQFSATLESQLASTTAKFSQLRTGRITPAKKGLWNTFHKQWTDLSAKLTENFQKWTPVMIANDFFYGSLYQMLQQSGLAIQRVHDLHQTYFTAGGDPKAFDIQVGQLTAAAQESITALKAKIDQAEKTPPTPNGMPRRDGI